jgi:hypothetical protein
MTHRSDQVVNAARYLHTAGMSSDELTAIHHFSRSGKRVTFGSILNYFAGSKELQANNGAFAERICYVASEHRMKPEKTFAALVHNALAKWPL